MTAECNSCDWSDEAEHSTAAAMGHASATGHGVWDE